MKLTKIDVPKLEGDILMLRIARELAMDQHDLSTILERNGVSALDWRRIAKHPRFAKYLQDELIAWNAATNTSERVKLKTAAMIEEWLPEAWEQMHNRDASLLHKTDLAKLISRLGGMDNGRVGTESVGERFSVTINLGADQKLNFNKEVTSKVIEGSTND